MKIYSPIATGNGAYILHRTLESAIPGYRVIGYNPWWTLFPPALHALCRSGHPDIIHSTPDYSIFSTRKDTPLVITFHGYMLDHAMRQHNTPLQNLHYSTNLKWFTHKALQKASSITAVSRFTAELVRSDTGLEQEIRVIYNGIDESCFFPTATRHTEAHGINVIFSGHLSHKKGADLLPEIAAKLSPGIKILYTSGLRSNKHLPTHSALQCVGRVPHDAMPQLYNKCDILLFPTVREGFGLAAAEAMACGLPVVASDCSSIPELVDDSKGGFLCPVGDAQSFANRINELADSPALRAEMGEYNRCKVERQFTLRRMVTDYMELFEEIISSR